MVVFLMKIDHFRFRRFLDHFRPFSKASFLVTYRLLNFYMHFYMFSCLLIMCDFVYLSVFIASCVFCSICKHLFWCFFKPLSLIFKIIYFYLISMDFSFMYLFVFSIVFCFGLFLERKGLCLHEVRLCCKLFAFNAALLVRNKSLQQRRFHVCVLTMDCVK